MRTLQVRLPDGATITRRTLRPLTHLVALRRKKAKAWAAYAWAECLEDARRRRHDARFENPEARIEILTAREVP